MKNTNTLENITPQSLLSEQTENEFLTADQMILVAVSKLESLKAMYRQQLGYDLAGEATMA
ncbi:hypothetical protein [Rufibacter hautae]|uniref:Uncharacterized protein n=1 Tax=Rufibacter hautae TaxID=2595005 RepID=A0A5B6TJR8_9BACT|nr:hypothetical protein [Rufibacter hautae]KAA3439615.1 hypothetical protein FOA19_02740 [Rufibacter hautae]